MAKKLPCLPKIGLCHDGHEAAMSAKDGTFFTMAIKLGCLLRMGLVMTAKKLPCLPKMGLCHDEKEAAVSAEDVTLS